MELSGFSGTVTALAVDPAAVYLAAADAAAVTLCDPASGARRRLDLPLHTITALAFSPNGELLAAAGWGQICLVEAWTGSSAHSSAAPARWTAWHSAATAGPWPRTSPATQSTYTMRPPGPYGGS